NTLGAAYYRAGRYREAADTLEANLKNQDAQFLAHDLYFLALACRKLGETDKARVYYQWALLWTQSHKKLVAPCLEELDAFRAEAAELLGIKDAKKRSCETKRPGRSHAITPVPPRPGLAPALGLRAGDSGFSIVSQTSFRKEKHHVVFSLAAIRLAQGGEPPVWGLTARPSPET